MINISIVAPIRNQTKELERLMESLKRTTTDSSKIEIVLIIDNCDKEMQNLKEHYEKEYQDFHMRIISVERSEHFVRDYYNFAALQAKGRWILAINIDVIFMTDNWDEKINTAMSTRAIEYTDDFLYGIVHDGLPREGEIDTTKCKKAIWHRKVDFSCWILTSNKFVQFYGGMMDTRNWLWGADHWTGIMWQKVEGGRRVVMIRDVLIDHISHHTKDLPQPESFQYFCGIMKRHPMIYNDEMATEQAKIINKYLSKKR